MTKNSFVGEVIFNSIIPRRTSNRGSGMGTQIFNLNFSEQICKKTLDQTGKCFLSHFWCSKFYKIFLEGFQLWWGPFSSTQVHSGFMYWYAQKSVITLVQYKFSVVQKVQKTPPMIFFHRSNMHRGACISHILHWHFNHPSFLFWFSFFTSISSRG